MARCPRRASQPATPARCRSTGRDSHNAALSLTAVAPGGCRPDQRHPQLLCMRCSKPRARIALTAVGLDAGIGIVHADQRARDSLALDVMETARPAVDRYVLDLVATRPFRAADFAETSAGQSRIMPILARQLAATTPAWSGEVDLRRARRQAARGRRRTRPTTDPPHRRHPACSPTRRQSNPAAPCTRASGTGSGVPRVRAGDRRRQRRCAECHATSNTNRLRDHQAATNVKRQDTGEHPSARADVRARIATAQRAHWEARPRDSAPGFTGRPSEFRRLILPRLAGAHPADLARATGLSRGYCAQIRDGKRVPHSRHWAAFQLAGLKRVPNPVTTPTYPIDTLGP